MSRYQRTKDENYMIALYEMAKATGDMETPFDFYAVGDRAGINPKAVDAISKLLIRANFIQRCLKQRCILQLMGANLWKRNCSKRSNYGVRCRHRLGRYKDCYRPAWLNRRRRPRSARNSIPPTTPHRTKCSCRRSSRRYRSVITLPGSCCKEPPAATVKGGPTTSTRRLPTQRRRRRRPRC